MSKKIRTALTASVAASALFALAMPTAWAEEPVNNTMPPSIGEVVAEVAAQGDATPETLSSELSLPFEGPGSLIFDGSEQIAAVVQFSGEPTTTALAALGEVSEIKTVSARFGVVSVMTSPEQFEAIGGIPGVSSVSPALEPLLGGAGERGIRPAAATVDGDACGPIPIEADGPLRSEEARAAFGVDGTGVTVGIISNTFNARVSPTSWADDVASGALPGAGNPCGRTLEVELVGDVKTTWSDTDEGRGMAQLVHGIAPGAKLLFADSGDDMYQMAQSVQALADAGADIIVDDVSFATEPYFQQGPLSVTIEEVREEYDLAYFTSAGNANEPRRIGDEILPINGWRSDAWRGIDCPEWVAPADSGDPLATATIECMDFGAADAPAPFNEFAFSDDIDDATSISVWGSAADPMFGPQSGVEMRMYAAESNALVGASSPPQPNNPVIMGAFLANPEQSVRLVLVRVVDEVAPTAGPAVWFKIANNTAAVVSTSADRALGHVGATIFGHAGDGSATSVAALPWDNPTKPEPFTSLGPSVLMFEPARSNTSPAASLPAPLALNTPMVAAVDGTQTSFFGVTDPDEPGVYRFHGTSAAAPHAAAVAALGSSYNPGVRGSALVDYVIATADANLENPMSGVSFAQVFGAGRVDALALLRAIPAPAPSPEPEPTPVPEPQPEPVNEPAALSPTVTDSDAVANTARAARLAQTGAADPSVWIATGGAFALVAAATVYYGVSRRTKHGRESVTRISE